jgi:uncharacterized damage-inducible protein DinB
VTPTKTELLDQLRSNAVEVKEKVGALPAEEFEKGRYENGWNSREILAHIASIEWTYPRLIEIATQPPAPESKGPPTRKARGGILSYNDRQVAKRAEASVEELLKEFNTNRSTLLDAVEATDEETLAKEVTSSGGFTGPLAQVLQWVAVDHVKAHLNDLLGES